MAKRRKDDSVSYAFYISLVVIIISFVNMHVDINRAQDNIKTLNQTLNELKIERSINLLEIRDSKIKDVAPDYQPIFNQLEKYIKKYKVTVKCEDYEVSFETNDLKEIEMVRCR